MIEVFAAPRRRRLLRSIAAGTLLLGPALARQAHGQQSPTAGWPARPITMVVPFPPGGPTDLVARVLAHQVGEQLGQSIVVENKPGANGNIGNAQVANAPPDGHSVLYNTSSITLSPSLYRKLAYDVERDLAPVTLTAVVPLALVINPSVPASDVKSFIAHARAHPGKLAYGSAGAGNVTHLAAFQFCRHFGIEATHVPYKGSAPADADLVGGQIQFMTETVNSILPYVKDKRLKVLAVTTARRIALFPDAPTLSEAGMGDFEAGAWQGVMVPAKTPTPIIDRLAAELNKALKHPAVLDKLAQQGAEPLGSTPAEYGAYLRKELARWADIVKATGVTLD